jgi:hypothetical protein
MALATARPLRRAVTSPVLPLVLLAATAFALLGRGSELAALCAAAAVAGVALSGST